jgi:hypothetical protein
MKAMADDARNRPDLFRWHGAIDEENLRQWLTVNGLADRLAPDLVSFWRQTGGGEAFETETLLGPFGDSSLGEGAMDVNRTLWQSGMPAQYFVFHIGLLTSAADTNAGDYVELAPDTFDVVRRFSTFDDWYLSTLRSEYGARYGLGTYRA